MPTLLRAGVLAWCAVAPLSAQTDPRLIGAVTLAREGLGDSARAVAGRVLAATRPTDPLYPEVLYTVAVVAANPDDQRLYLQRVAVEFSRSDWADDARLQLAQLAYAAGDVEGTTRQVERLLADYPLSPLRATAALWGARAAIDLRQLPLACQWTALGLDAGSDNVELKSQLEFQRQRCRGMMRPDSMTARDSAPAPKGPQWLVQVAAFKTKQTADQTVVKLKQVKVPATVVRDAGLYKVRAGPYDTRTQADAAMTTIRRQVGGRPFVIEAP
jgi:hypothetical protein